MERFVADCSSPHPSRGALCVERQSAPQAFLQHCVMAPQQCVMAQYCANARLEAWSLDATSPGCGQAARPSRRRVKRFRSEPPQPPPQGGVGLLMATGAVPTPALWERGGRSTLRTRAEAPGCATAAILRARARARAWSRPAGAALAIAHGSGERHAGLHVHLHEARALLREGVEEAREVVGP